MSAITGEAENVSEVDPVILIIPMSLLALFALLPFMVGRMLNVGCTVNYSKRIANVLLVNVCLMIAVSILSIILDLIYFSNIASLNKAGLVYSVVILCHLAIFILYVALMYLTYKLAQ